MPSSLLSNLSWLESVHGEVYQGFSGCWRHPPIFISSWWRRRIRLCASILIFQDLNSINSDEQISHAINPLFEALQGAAIFSKPYQRITLLGLSSIFMMPYSLQALVNDVLTDFPNHFVFVNLDDILILSKTPSEHVSQVHQVLQQLLQNKLFRAEKCEFHSITVSFLGFERRQVKTDTEKVKAVELLCPLQGVRLS